ncbi:hypothetical protein D3C84_1088400 [compost metagenome]
MAGLFCICSAISRSERRLSSRVWRTRSYCSLATGRRTPSSCLSQASRVRGAGFGVGMQVEPNWLFAFTAYSLAQYFR